MAYRDFAYYYDALNSQADYDALCARLVALLRENGVVGGIVADLGCGTGECTLRLAGTGYDMIAVDASPEMLGVLRDKLDTTGHNVLLLCQELSALDLYGTIAAGVSTFDTFNHLPPDRLARAIQRAALFLEPGGLLAFDMNTPYKHLHILASGALTVDSLKVPGLACRWENTLDDAHQRTRIQLAITQDGQEVATEAFWEYYYTARQVAAMLAEAGLVLLHAEDGERFTPLAANSQRVLYLARKSA